jgi:hypothetical protein
LPPIKLKHANIQQKTHSLRRFDVFAQQYINQWFLISIFSINMGIPYVSFRVVYAICFPLVLSASAFRASGPTFASQEVLPQRRMTIAPDEESGKDSTEGNDEVIAQAVVKIDDGGSDLTDRFKYQVGRDLCSCHGFWLHVMMPSDTAVMHLYFYRSMH